METITQNHNQSKYKAKEPSLNRYVYNTAPSPKSLGSLLKKGQKDFKTWKIRGLAMRLWQNVRCHTHEVSPTLLTKHQLNKDDMHGHAKVNSESPGVLNYTQRTIGI